MSSLTRRATTIVCVRRNGEVAMAGDGQVTLGDTIAKANAVKVRKIKGLEPRMRVCWQASLAVLQMACALERFEATLKSTPTNPHEGIHRSCQTMADRSCPASS